MKKWLKIVSGVVSVGTVVASVFVKNPDSKKTAEKVEAIAVSVVQNAEDSTTLGYNKGT
jgi:hypothetical protein